MHIFERILRVLACPFIVIFMVFVHVLIGLVKSIPAIVLYVKGELPWDFTLRDFHNKTGL